jgi:hypothetical protein
LPNVSGTIALTTNLTDFVTLSTAQTITATKTFNNSGSASNIIVNHTSGSGIALDITKGGNGEGIRVNKTSGSGNAATIIGTLEATTLVKTGGTASQFLMADGSVNTNILPSGAYLPLTGGTLTGALNGTSASFSGSVTSLGFRSNSLDGFVLRNNANTLNLGGITRRSFWAGGSSEDTQIFAETGYSIFLNPGGLSSIGLTLASTGAATFSSSVTAVQASIGYTTAAPTNGLIVNGDVGIGTTDPFDDRLRVTASNTTGSDVYSYINATNEIDADFRIFISGSASSDKRALIGSSTNTSLSLMTNNAERMRITSGGNILFGTQTLSTTHAYFDNAGSDRMVLNLGSSTTSNANLIAFNNPNGNVGTIATNGSLTLYNTTSDYRLKEDLQEIVGLEKVLALKVYDYKWKSDESRMDGVLAHELAEVLPYAVSGEKDELNEDGTDKMQSVDYSKIVPILIKAIQELKAEIDILKQK